jgi:hypothetical protein
MRSRPEASLDARALLAQLEHVAEALGMAVRYEKLSDDADAPSAKSGSCRLGSDRFIIVDSGLELNERCRVIVDELKKCDISSIYVPPIVRRLIGGPEGDY